MPSPVIAATAVAAFVGLLLNGTILYLVLKHGRQGVHWLFAALLLIFVIWDLAILLIMLRNSYEAELIVYGYIAIAPCLFISALIYHFTNTYVGRSAPKSILFLWALSLLMLVALYGQIDDVYHYGWGNIFKIKTLSLPAVLLILLTWIIPNLAACWLLLQNRKKILSRVKRRHHLYLLTGFFIMTFVAAKALVVIGVNASFVLPMGMILNDLFAALIGIAIVKDQLLDITVIIKIGVLYSLLLGSFIFLFSFSEHILANRLGELFGGHSEFTHLAIIAVVIILLIPVKLRLEHFLETRFKNKIVEF